MAAFGLIEQAGVPKKSIDGKGFPDPGGMSRPEVIRRQGRRVSTG
jgi:hypothetical protein